MIACCTMKLFLLGVGLCSAQVRHISCYVIRISAYLLKKRLELDTFSYICLVMSMLVNIRLHVLVTWKMCTMISGYLLEISFLKGILYSRRLFNQQL